MQNINLMMTSFEGNKFLRKMHPYAAPNSSQFCPALRQGPLAQLHPTAVSKKIRGGTSRTNGEFQMVRLYLRNT